MKLIRFFVILILVLLLAICGIWFYVTKHVASEINSKYAGQKFAVQGVDQSEYSITFDQVKPSGFPFNVAWDVDGWSEESKIAKIRYTSPVQIGYNLLLQQVFVSYNGEIISTYKPEKNGFGSRLAIDNYKIKVDLPLSLDLIHTVKDMQDPVSMINHLGDITISSGAVEVFDLVDNEKFYAKEYERLDLSFVPQKRYDSLEDLLSNIPQHYKANYSVNILPNTAPPRRLPISLFYGFSALPSGMDMKANAVIKTKGRNLNDIGRGMEVKAEVSGDFPVFKIGKLKLDYKSTNEGLLMRDYSIDASSDIYVKSGMFEELFERYSKTRGSLKLSAAGKVVDRELQYIINHRHQFKFEELEDNDYDFHLKMHSEKDKNTSYVKIDDLSVNSQDSGVQLRHEMESSGVRWNAGGLLTIKNYPAVVDFTSAYIYRFGKFKFLSEEARELYVDTNTDFLKSISDDPKTKTNDLSFEYKVDSRYLNKAKFGSVRVDQIGPLYSLKLYQKLFGKVGTEGDVVSRMQKIIPDINSEDPILKQILPKIQKGKNSSIEKSAKEELKKIVPSEARDVLNKIIPKKKLDKDKLLKNLF